MPPFRTLALLFGAAGSATAAEGPQAFLARVTHAYADDAGVKIHPHPRGLLRELAANPEQQRNYPREPYTGEPPAPLPNAAMAVLMFHGLDDRALNHAALNRTWEWVDKDTTLVTVPGVGHWVHRDAADLVSQTIKWWLAMRR